MRIYRQVEKGEKNENLKTNGNGREKNVPAGGTDC